MAGDLSVALLDAAPMRRGPGCLSAGWAKCVSLSGILMVTAAALLFGVVAALVKATNLPTLLMLQCRSVLEWAIGIGVAYMYAWQGGKRNNSLQPLPQAEAAMAVRRTLPAVPMSPSPPRDADPTSLSLLLLGPPHLRWWLILRAFLYWAFLAGWWLALTSMPIGDATTIVYCGPIFTATFARIFLGERIDWTFYPIIVLDACGIVLITRPAFLFPSSDGSSSAGSPTSSPGYMLGVASALFSAVVAGLLPVCTRISKDCFWTAVNHVSSALSAVVFTPLALAIWFALDDGAIDEVKAAFGLLITPEPNMPLVPGLGRLSCLVGATITGFAGLALQTLGYQREEVRHSPRPVRPRVTAFRQPRCACRAWCVGIAGKRDDHSRDPLCLPSPVVSLPR